MMTGHSLFIVLVTCSLTERAWTHQMSLLIDGIRRISPNGRYVVRATYICTFGTEFNTKHAISVIFIQIIKVTKNA